MNGLFTFRGRNVETTGTFGPCSLMVCWRFAGEMSNLKADYLAQIGAKYTVDIPY